LALPGRVWLDGGSANYALYDAVVGGGGGAASAAPSEERVLDKMSPVQLLKAVKNAAEVEGACRKDSLVDEDTTQRWTRTCWCSRYAPDTPPRRLHAPLA
jgi:hypothetical protein